MNIKRIIREEMDDLEWMDDIEPKSNVPDKYTAWCLMNIPNTSNDALIVQAFLHSNGFKWPNDDGIDMSLRPSSVGSVRGGDINDGSYTFFGHHERGEWGVNDWLDLVSDRSDQKNMDVFIWDRTKTQYSHTLKVEE
jgi:hypothetical protein